MIKGNGKIHVIIHLMDLKTAVHIKLLQQLQGF